MFVSLEMDTGINGFNEASKRASRREQLYVPEDHRTIRGFNSTVFSYAVMASSYTGKDGDSECGLYALTLSRHIGSLTDGNSMNTQHTFSAVISLHTDMNILSTTWSRRQTFATTLTSAASTFVSFMSIFGGAVLIIETVNFMDLPCLRPITKKHAVASFLDASPNPSSSPSQTELEQSSSVGSPDSSNKSI